MEIPIIKFKKWECLPEIGWYSNGRVAISLISAVNGEPIAVGTVNVPSADVPGGHVLIKNWSENSGMVTALKEAGIIEAPVGVVMTGFVQAPVCKLTEKGLELVERAGDANKPEPEDVVVRMLIRVNPDRFVETQHKLQELDDEIYEWESRNCISVRRREHQDRCLEKLSELEGRRQF